MTYLTEGYLRFVQRAMTRPAEPTGLGVPRSFARTDHLPVEPGENLDPVVEIPGVRIAPFRSPDPNRDRR